MFESYNTLSGMQKNQFSDVCNKLLSNTFLAKAKENNKNDYYFVLNFKDLFEEYFKVINYELFLDNNLGICMLQAPSNSLKLKRDETLLLLITRILYHEKSKETSLNDNIVISVNDLQEKFDYLELKKRINKTDLIQAIRTFRRFNLIEVIGDINSLNIKIIIMPTILYAINTKEINEIYNSVTKILQEIE